MAVAMSHPDILSRADRRELEDLTKFGQTGEPEAFAARLREALGDV